VKWTVLVWSIRQRWFESSPQIQPTWFQRKHPHLERLFLCFWSRGTPEKNYSNATKFNFLNSRLSGEAKALLLGLVSRNDNYTVAVLYWRNVLANRLK
jgi:hypothetical protein